MSLCEQCMVFTGHSVLQVYIHWLLVGASALLYHKLSQQDTMMFLLHHFIG